MPFLSVSGTHLVQTCAGPVNDASVSVSSSFIKFEILLYSDGAVSLMSSIPTGSYSLFALPSLEFHKI